MSYCDSFVTLRTYSDSLGIRLGRNIASIEAMILTTEVLLTDLPEEEKPAVPAMPEYQENKKKKCKGISCHEFKQMVGERR